MPWNIIVWLVSFDYFYSMLEKYIHLLGLSENNLSVKEVERRFKFLAKNIHPDINPDAMSQQKMKELIEARDKLKEFLQYSLITKTYETHELVYQELKDDLFRLIEKKFQILDGYALCRQLWPSIEAYDQALKDNPTLAAGGGFAKLFKHCGFIQGIYNEKEKKYSYKKNSCSITSAKKLLKILQEYHLVDIVQKGLGRSSRLRVTINRDNLARFIINNAQMLGYKIKVIQPPQN